MDCGQASCRSSTSGCVAVSIKLARPLIMAACRDAANRRMRKAGRSAWDETDYDHACDLFWRLTCEQGKQRLRGRAVK